MGGEVGQAAGPLNVTVAWSEGPRALCQHALQLPPGSTLAAALAALAAAGLNPPAANGPEWQTGIWGRRVTQEQPLQDGDRVELYRALRVDPKHARRERFGQQGARAAGLFAQRRPGSKPGY